MLGKLLFGLLVVAIAATGLRAATVSITHTSAQTVNLPGYTAFIFTAHSDEPILGFDFYGDGRNLAGPPSELLWQGLSFEGPIFVQTPTFDPLTQVFRWDTSGSKVGTYKANVIVRHPDPFLGSGTATLIIHVVPEPASAVLAGFMALSWLVVRRARSSLQ